MKRGLKRELAICGGVLTALAWVAGQRKTSVALGALSLGVLALPEPRRSVDGKVVVITGGSRGLGFALAREYLRMSARVALIARDVDELKRAQTLLSLEFGPSSQIHVFSCDVSERASFAQTLDDIATHCGSIDTFVNNAGSMIVGPLETMSDVDFENHYRIHVQPVVQSTAWLQAHFVQRGLQGCIVNISSIGGRIAVPHMSPYVATKFALGGFSETSAAELAGDGIQVTTVYPGLMQTGSPSKALFKGSPEKEYAWFSASDATPGLAMNADEAARQIIDGVCAQNTRIILTAPARLGHFAYAVLPEIFGALMKTVARLLPSGHERTLTSGRDARHWVDSKAWYTPFKKRLRHLENQFNQ